MLCVCVFFLVVLIYQVHLPGKCSLYQVLQRPLYTIGFLFLSY